MISIRFQLPTKTIKESIQTVTELAYNTIAFNIFVLFPVGPCRFEKPFFHSWDEARSSEREGALSHLSCISDQGEVPPLLFTSVSVVDPVSLSTPSQPEEIGSCGGLWLRK